MKNSAKLRSDLRYLLISGIIVTLLSVFVIAYHTADKTGEAGTTFNADDNSSYVRKLYNITINVSDLAGGDANITGVNITLWGNLVFVTNSNFTNNTNGTSFTNTSTVLSWKNWSVNYIIGGNQQSVQIQFNATASIPGVYNITITMLNNTDTVPTILNSTNITVIINDTQVPHLIKYNASTPADNENLSQTSITINVTGEDNTGGVYNITISLFNSTGSEINTSNNFSTTLAGANFTGLSDGVYQFNATINDTYSNTNFTATRNFTIDTTAPSISFSCTPTTSNTGDTVTCGCSGSDATTGINTTYGVNGYSFTVNPSTSDTGTYTTSCSARDRAGNSVSASTTYTVELSGGGGGSSNSSTTSYWTKTVIVNDDDFKKGHTEEFSVKKRVQVMIGTIYHSVGVVDLTSTQATINVSSTPQQAVFNIGDEKKFEVSGDNYYDVLVNLNSIKNNKANITVKSIHEEIPIEEKESAEVKGEEGTKTVGGVVEEEKSNIWIWIVVVIIVVLIILGGGYWLRKNR